LTQTFWTLSSLGKGYNDAALKGFLNVCLDDPLPGWEMKGMKGEMKILDFRGFTFREFNFLHKSENKFHQVG